MIFGKEREAVRNATRAIRDLVLRPGREHGGGGLFGGLGAVAAMAMEPLRELPEMATRLPGTLRELGDRVTAIPGGRRRAPAIAFAAQALAGSIRLDATLRERYLNLLAASMDRDTAARVHPAFLSVLRELTPDEVRIVSQFQHDGPYPLLTVAARRRFGERLGTELRHFSGLAAQAGCERPDRFPLYVDNLCRLGLTELRAVRVADDTRIFRALEAAPEVKAAITRIESNAWAQLGFAERSPSREGSGTLPGVPAGSKPLGGAAGGDADDPVVADLQRKALYVTSFGRQFYEACEYRPEPIR